MARPKLKALAREETGSANARRLRKAEVIPAVIYGGKKGPSPVSVNMAEILKLGHGSAIENMMLDISLESGEKGKSQAVLVKDLQHDPVTGALIHIDFSAVSLHEKISIDVQIERVGEATGVTQQGGVLEHLLRSVKVECLPADIPEKIELDVEHLNIGDSLYVKDIVPPSGVTILDDMGLAVFSVAAPRVEEEVAAAPEEEAAEAAPGEATEEAVEEKAGPEKKKE